MIKMLGTVQQDKLTLEKINDLTSNSPTWTHIVDVSEVVCITGMKRHGKSALTYHLLEELGREYKKKPYSWGIPIQKQDLFPEDFTHFMDLDDIQSYYDGIIGLDEIHRSFSARKSLSSENVTFSEVMTFSGQNNQILILSTLNNGIIDINTFRIANPVLVYKRVGNLQAASERSALRSYTFKAMEAWKTIPRGRKDTPERNLENQLSYVISDIFIGWMQNPMPRWWDQNTSEMHSSQKQQRENPFDPSGLLNKARQYETEWYNYLFRKNTKDVMSLKDYNKLKKQYPIEKFYFEQILKQKS